MSMHELKSINEYTNERVKKWLGGEDDPGITVDITPGMYSIILRHDFLTMLTRLQATALLSSGPFMSTSQLGLSSASECTTYGTTATGLGRG